MKSYVIWALRSLLKMFDNKIISADEVVELLRSLYTSINESEE